MGVIIISGHVSQKWKKTVENGDGLKKIWAWVETLARF
jgi:hypothetical protein